MVDIVFYLDRALPFGNIPISFSPLFSAFSALSLGVENSK
jgi:hypothetical protein